jgi:hypothetical protein
MNLPPPDPSEPFSLPPGHTTLGQPLTVFLRSPSSEAQRIAGAILNARPGLLFVA